jgi:hypothetical protein
MRMAGPSAAGGTPPRRHRALQRIDLGWQRRLRATGVLLAMIAVTAALAG